MRVLVTYGSKMGGTEGIAVTIGERLEERGFDVDVRPAGIVDLVDPYEAVLVGGGLYANRWFKDAVRFVRRQRKALRNRAVWLFSSGPLDESATESVIPPTKQVQKLIDMVDARGHMTFGGKLDEDVKGFPASAMAKEKAGDYRSREHIQSWADSVASALVAPPTRAG